MPENENSNGFVELKGIIARLRGTEGCPWDRKQTHDSLKPYLIEECYEVLQSLEEGAPKKLCEELGDLLLQIMLHAQIAAEAGQFDIEDVLQGISDKLIHRHPHVFGGYGAKDAEEVEQNWESLKQRERQESQSLLSDVPRQMPALLYSQSIQRRVAGVGFDWEKTEDIIDKLAEEVTEIKQAPDHSKMAEEFGDLLFTLVNIARRLNMDSEMVLRSANQRFYQRFSYMEEACHKRGVSFEGLPFDEQNALWEEAKQMTE